jgi:lactoylglutathione lyase
MVQSVERDRRIDDVAVDPEAESDQIRAAAGPNRLLHTMLRVGHLERSLSFYVGILGMTLFRREDYPNGRFTLAFLGYGSEETSPAIELTHNWDRDRYEPGSAYGHIALSVPDAAAACSRFAALGVNILRAAGPMAHASSQGSTPEVIAFISDPDGYRIELIEWQDRAVPS